MKNYEIYLDDNYAVYDFIYDHLYYVYKYAPSQKRVYAMVKNDIFEKIEKANSQSFYTKNNGVYDALYMTIEDDENPDIVLKNWLSTKYVPGSKISKLLDLDNHLSEDGLTQFIIKEIENNLEIINGYIVYDDTPICTIPQLFDYKNSGQFAKLKQQELEHIISRTLDNL